MPEHYEPLTPYERVRRYIVNVLIALDQFANALMGGDPDETISSRAGRALRSKHKPLWARVLCWLLNWIDPRHCIDAIEPDEGVDCNHNHCWHDAGMMYAVYPAKYVQECCWCGEKRVITVDMYYSSTHGPYRPSLWPKPDADGANHHHDFR